MSSVELQQIEARRIGLKGPRATQWLGEQAIDVPPQFNSWLPLHVQRGEDLCVRLGASEYLLEQSGDTAIIDNVGRLLQERIDGVYAVLREDSEYLLSGAGSLDILAQVCNIDFASLDLNERPAVMTMMTGVAVTVVPQGNSARRRFRIWCDPSYGDYLSSTLQLVIRDTRMTGEGES